MSSWVPFRLPLMGNDWSAAKAKNVQSRTKERSPTALVLLVLELDVPMGSVTEGLVLGSSAATKRVVLAGSTFTLRFLHKIDTASDGIRPILRDGDLGLPILISVLGFVDRVAESA